jgi:hypothetical protein
MRDEERMMRNGRVFILTVCLMIGIGGAGAAGGAIPDYFGRTGARVIQRTGCNAGVNVQIPGTTDLFVGRHLFKKDGFPLTSEEKCGPGEAVREAIKSNRWGVVLSQLDWQNKRFILVKPLLISMTVVPAGPLRGAILRASDPDIVTYRGQYLLAFECLVVNGGKYRVQGTSACLAPYDPARRELRLDRAEVVVSGEHTGPVFHSASVPQLLVYRGNLYLYWSTLSQSQGRFTRDEVRGVQLEADGAGFFWAKGIGHVIYAISPPSVEVWGPDASKRMSDTAVDIKSVWVHGNDVIMVAGLGGGGCAGPGPQPGCFRMAMAKAPQPLGDHIFNRSPLLDEEQLPTNPQGYTRPIRDLGGGYSFIGGFAKPVNNGYSELRPVPPDWSNLAHSEVVIFPFPDRRLWPTAW